MDDQTTLDDVTLNDVIALLDAEHPRKERRKAYFREWRKNLRPEAFCILACELGELGTEILAYHADAPHMNELGFLGGVTLGGLYAFQHVFRAARRHYKKPSKLEALAYVGTTESGCILGATGTEYAAGKIVSSMSTSPFSLGNIGIRVGALVPAFIIGLGLMSYFTYLKRREVTRFVAQDHALELFHRGLKDHVETSIQEDRVTVHGKRSDLTVVKKPLPQTLQHHDTSGRHQLYIVRSPIARYNQTTRNALASFIHDTFINTTQDIQFVENLYACQAHA